MRLQTIALASSPDAVFVSGVAAFGVAADEAFAAGVAGVAAAAGVAGWASVSAAKEEVATRTNAVAAKASERLRKTRPPSQINIHSDAERRFVAKY
jgi:hypothetical protein